LLGCCVNGGKMAEMVEMAEWRNGEMVRNGGMAEWCNGGMAELRNGGMVEWRNGYIPTTFMVHADDDTDTF
jgi:hypothetical protein